MSRRVIHGAAGAALALLLCSAAAAWDAAKPDDPAAHAAAKASLKALCPAFNTNRMVREYVEQLYVKALETDKIEYDIHD